VQNCGVSIPEPVQDYSEREMSGIPQQQIIMFQFPNRFRITLNIDTGELLEVPYIGFQFPNRFRITLNSPYLNPLRRKGLR